MAAASSEQGAWIQEDFLNQIQQIISWAQENRLDLIENFLGGDRRIQIKEEVSHIERRLAGIAKEKEGINTTSERKTRLDRKLRHYQKQQEKLLRESHLLLKESLSELTLSLTSRYIQQILEKGCFVTAQDARGLWVLQELAENLKNEHLKHAVEYLMQWLVDKIPKFVDELEQQIKKSRTITAEMAERMMHYCEIPAHINLYNNPGASELCRAQSKAGDYIEVFKQLVDKMVEELYASACLGFDPKTPNGERNLLRLVQIERFMGILKYTSPPFDLLPLKTKVEATFTQLISEIELTCTTESVIDTRYLLELERLRVFAKQLGNDFFVDVFERRIAEGRSRAAGSVHKSSPLTNTLEKAHRTPPLSREKYTTEPCFSQHQTHFFAPMTSNTSDAPSKRRIIRPTRHGGAS
jgi:hypothetical protein